MGILSAERTRGPRTDAASLGSAPGGTPSASISQAYEVRVLVPLWYDIESADMPVKATK